MNGDERECYVWAMIGAMGLAAYGLASGHIWPQWAPAVRALLATFLGI